MPAHVYTVYSQGLDTPLLMSIQYIVRG